MVNECIFLTISPNRRHSCLLLKLARARKHDVGLEGDDDVSRARRRYAGSAQPPIFYEGTVDDSDDIETACVELHLPDVSIRQAINAQDPLSSVHHYLVCTYILLPAAFGIRMCLNCPRCNVDIHDPSIRMKMSKCGCQDVRGKNAKPMGGVGGLAEALALATEFQGDGTPHGHGFTALTNLYQHCSLQDIAAHIEKGINGLSSEDVVARIKAAFSRNLPPPPRRFFTVPT